MFLGEKKCEDVRAELNAADVFVLPSRSGGLPLSFLEAMVAGTLVVATKVSGVPKVLRGMTVAPESEEALVTVLTVPERAERMRRAALKRVETYSVSAATNAYQRTLFNRSA